MDYACQRPHDIRVTGPTFASFHTEAQEVVYETLPNGQVGVLRPELTAEDDDALWTLDEAGMDEVRRDRAMEALFGPWPTVAEVMRAAQRGAA